MRQAKGGDTNTSTFEMEFTGLLRGLKTLNNVRGSDEFRTLFSYHVHWHTDCEGLLLLLQPVSTLHLSAAGPDRGVHYSGDPNHPHIDLILSYARLVHSFTFTATHHKREAGNAHFQWCDLNASSMRVMLKGFLHEETTQ